MNREFRAAFAVVPTQVVFDHRLSQLGFRVYAALRCYVGDGDYAAVSPATIATGLNCDIGAVAEALWRLHALGYANVHPDGFVAQQGV